MMIVYYYHLVTESEATFTSRSNKNISPHLQHKARCLYFIYCMFYVAARAFVEKPFLIYELTTTTLIR